MRSVNKTFLKSSTCLPLIALALSGCATVDSGPVIKAGDTVGVHFTCRLPNGDIAVSSEKSVSDDRVRAKSPVFVPRQADGLLEVIAGGDPAYPTIQVTSIEEDVMQDIATRLPGQKSGESRTMDLASSPSPNGELKLARVRHASKEKRISVEEFKTGTGKAPEKGQTVYMDGELPGVVTEVNDGTVVMTFSAADGTEVKTPLGPGKVRDAGSRYDIVIEAKEGDLMRMGPLVGRVQFADDRDIVLDFSRKFGGETLRCDVKTEIIKAGAEKALDAPVSPGPAPHQAGAAGLKGEAAAVERKAEDSASRDEIQRGVNLLHKAVSDAALGGKTSISIDADALSSRAAKGDLVTVRFTASDPDGTPLSLPEEMARQDSPQEIIAGNDEVFPGLGDAVVGMAAGGKKQITLSSDKAFGRRKESDTATFRRNNTYPAMMKLPADEYVKRYGGFPSVGKEVPLLPFVTTKVAEVGEKEVTLALTAQDGARFTRPIGTVTVSVGKDGITLHLDPKQGAPFSADNRQGVISASNEETFTVDFNHPLAGKTIVVDLEVVSLTKAADLPHGGIAWQEDHDAGLALARTEGKPAVLVLYADWCGFCKRLFNETIPDPRIERIKDKFVWVKVNSDKDTKYKQQYGQNGFPMIVVLKADGSVIKKIDGYRDPMGLKAELDGV